MASLDFRRLSRAHVQISIVQVRVHLSPTTILVALAPETYLAAVFSSDNATASGQVASI